MKEEAKRKGNEKGSIRKSCFNLTILMMEYIGLTHCCQMDSKLII
jgi:hypothetical protein